MINENEVRTNCGRTENRGNWVELVYNGVSVKISDDRKKATPQVKIRDICLEIISQIVN